MTSNEGNRSRVDFIRINELVVGDVFLFNGAWRKVMKIKDGRLTYRINTIVDKRNIATISANSKQFVEIERKQDIKPTKYEEDNLCTTTDHLR